MDIEVALNAIKEWYEGESFHIDGITTEHIGDSDDFDQHKDFISVKGYQNSVGEDGDSFEGRIFFEFEKGKYIATSFFM